MTTCNTCGKPDHSPYRVYDDHGHVINGCVDACHTDRLVSPSASNSWHYRPEAKDIRRRNERGRQGKGYGS